MLVLPIKAIGKKVMCGPYGGMYTPKCIKEFENTVANFAQNYMKKNQLSTISRDIPVFVGITFKFRMPKMWSKTKKESLIGQYVTIKPDVDNACKCILDGLKKVWFEDDAQVAFTMIKKIWDEHNSIEIEYQIL